MMNLIDFNKDVFSVSDVGLVRQANEDNCFAAETPNGFLFVVCDGMGGHIGGAKASAIAVNSIVNFFTKEHYAAVRQALEDALVFANKQILGVAAEQPGLKGMGTTACVLLLRDAQAWFAHIGDSRIYLFCNKQQQLHRLTKDHSVVQGLIDQGMISEAEAEHHPNKNRILKTLGIKKDIQPDVCTMPVLPAKGDVFLLCSDGLSGMVTDDILQHILEQKISLQEKGENMLALAKQAGGTDNITLQLIHIGNSPHENSVFKSKNSLHSPGTTGKKGGGKNKRNILLITVIALFALASIIVLLLPKEKEQKNIPQTHTTTIEIPDKWEEAVKNMKPLGMNEAGKNQYFQKSKNGNIINGVIVYNNHSYFIGTFYDKTLGYGEIKGEYFNKDGTFNRLYSN